MGAGGIVAGVEVAPPIGGAASRRAEPASAGFLESFPSSRVDPSSQSSDSGSDPLIAAQSAPTLRRDLLEKPRGRVVVTSHPTQTYNAQALFPALKVFQYARPMPESRPFGTLTVDPGTEGTRKMLAGSYGRSSEASSRWVDAHQ